MAPPEKTSFGVCRFRITRVIPINIDNKNQKIPITGSIVKNKAAT